MDRILKSILFLLTYRLLHSVFLYPSLLCLQATVSIAAAFSLKVMCFDILLNPEILFYIAKIRNFFHCS